MSMDSPVCGLRPVRAARSRVSNRPEAGQDDLVAGDELGGEGVKDCVQRGCRVGLEVAVLGQGLRKGDIAFSEEIPTGQVSGELWAVPSEDPRPGHRRPGTSRGGSRVHLHLIA